MMTTILRTVVAIVVCTAAAATAIAYEGFGNDAAGYAVTAPFVRSPDRTVEDLVIDIDPSAGHDFQVSTTLVTQAEFDRHGPFSSYRGALASVPRFIGHRVRLVHARGTFLIGNNEAPTISGSGYFGDISAHTFSSGGFVHFDTDSSLEPVDGTPEMAFSSSSDGGTTITMQGDPGMAENSQSGKWLKITGGSGSASLTAYVAIRSHSGPVFRIVNHFYAGVDLDSTTRFRIVEPATSLVWGEEVNVWLKGAGISGGGALPEETPAEPYMGHFLGVQAIIGPLRLVSTGWGSLAIEDASVVFWGTVFDSTDIFVRRSQLRLDKLIIDMKGSPLPGISAGAGTTIDGGSNESSWLIRGTTGDGISIYGGGEGATPVSLFLYRGAIDDCTGDAIDLQGPAIVDLVTLLASSGNDGFGLAINRPGVNWGVGIVSLSINIPDAISFGGLSGDLGDIQIGGDRFGYAELAGTGDDRFVASDGTTVFLYNH